MYANVYIGVTIQKLHQLSDDRITRETLSYNNPCPSSPSSNYLTTSSIHFVLYIYKTKRINYCMYDIILLYFILLLLFIIIIIVAVVVVVVMETSLYLGHFSA